MTAANWIQLVLIAATAVACAYRYRSVRRNPGDRAVRAIFLALLNLVFVFLLGLPQFYWFVYPYFGSVPSLPQLLFHCFTIVMTYYAEEFAIRVSTGEPNHASRRRLLRLFLLVTGVCYVIGPLRLGIPILPPNGHPDITVTLYVIAWQGYPTLALTRILRVWGRGRLVITTRRYLRLGVGMMTLGALFGLAEVVHKVTYQVVANLGGRMPYQESGSGGIQAVLLLPVVVLIMVGVTIPSWGPRLARRRARRRSYRQMGALAAAVRTACPEVTPPGRAWSPRLRHHQRVVEIRDALIGPLRPYLRTRPDAPEDPVTAEATSIADAINGKNTGRVPEGGPPPALTSGADLDADADWLAKVSTAYAALPATRVSTACRTAEKCRDRPPG
jgi:hypothetical protein